MTEHLDTRSRPAAQDNDRLVGFPLTAGRLIGRDIEIAELTRLLREHRLITVTGPGGVGKTRTAIEAAKSATTVLESSAVFVELAPIRDPSLVIATIARACGVSDAGPVTDADTLAAHLSGNSLLLVLDNLEQVAECGLEISRLLERCHGLRMLTTSRTTLHLRIEQVVDLSPLALPGIESSQAVQGSSLSPAEQLFIERAEALIPDFSLTSATALAIAEICIRLDGLPLAIELAAARLRTLSPEALLARLDQRLSLLTAGPLDAPVRQRTLRDTLSWSYELLSLDLQRLFRQLSVFVGGFTADTAERIRRHLAIQEDGQTSIFALLEGLSSLIDASLLRRATSDLDPRYKMLETVRESGIEQLAVAGELETTREAHALSVVDLVEELRPSIEGPNGPATLRQYEAEHSNIRAALEYAIESENAGLANRIIASTWKFWVVHSHHPEGKRWMETALEMPGNMSPEYRLETLYAITSFALDGGEIEQAKRWGEEGLALARRSNKELPEARMLFVLGLVARSEGSAEALSLFDEALVLAYEASRTISFADHMTAMILLNIASCAHDLDDPERAERAAIEARSIWERRGDPWGLALATEFLGLVAFTKEDLFRAAIMYRQSMNLYRNLADRAGMANCLSGIAMVAGAAGRHTIAARLASAAHATRQRLQKPVPSVFSEELERCIKRASSLLGARRFSAAWSSGEAISLDEAFAEATYLDVSPANVGKQTFGLSARELEVLRLIAAGKKDREIADELFISYRTVTSHVNSILTKFGVDSRTAASADAIRLGLV